MGVVTFVIDGFMTDRTGTGRDGGVVASHATNTVLEGRVAIEIGLSERGARNAADGCSVVDCVRHVAVVVHVCRRLGIVGILDLIYGGRASVVAARDWCCRAAGTALARGTSCARCATVANLAEF